MHARERERKKEFGTGVPTGRDDAEAEEGSVARAHTRDRKLRATVGGGGKLAGFEIISHDDGSRLRV